MDEDELLYGESSGPSKPPSSKPTSAAGPTSISTSALKSPSSPPTAPSYEGWPAESTHWALVARENGYLEIYSMPDFQHSFLVKDFSLKPRVLNDFDLAGTDGGIVFSFKNPY